MSRSDLSPWYVIALSQRFQLLYTGFDADKSHSPPRSRLFSNKHYFPLVFSLAVLRCFDATLLTELTAVAEESWWPGQPGPG